MTVNQNFRMVAGDTPTLEYTITDADGNTVDITDYTAIWGLAENAQATPEFTHTTGGGGITLTDPANGVLQVALTSDDTDSLEGRYYYQLELTSPTGNIQTVSEGFVQIVPSIVSGA